MKTNYVIVVDYDEDENYLEDQYLLGWNNNYDWFDTETLGEEIITVGGYVFDNNWGLIETDRWTMVYAGDDGYLSDLKDHCKAANEEDISCTVCRLEKDHDGYWTVIPV